jgi:phosphoserine aminotransferase
MHKQDLEKAGLLYNEIDSNPLFVGTTAIEDRSYMNVCFVMTRPEMEKEFFQWATEQGLSGIKGHRSVGGFRVSLYNAQPIENVKHVVDVMREFALKHA